MTYRLGLEGFVHYDTTGVLTPTWLDATIVQEVTLNMERAEAEIKNRDLDWALFLTGKLAASIEITMTYKAGDAAYEAFRDAFTGNNLIGVAIMSEDIATVGSEGLVADMLVTAMTRGEPLEETMTITFTLRPAANYTAAPSYQETSA